jgi:hypothetical protein
MLIEYPAAKAGTAFIIPSSVINIEELAFHNCVNLTSVTLSDGIKSIENGTFETCMSLTNVTIGNGVTNIEASAFEGCFSLTSIYFKGNAPNVSHDVFNGDNKATVYYLPGTTGWSTNIGGLPTALWVLPYPVILTTASIIGVQTNGFGFTISWATNIPVVVEASTTLANPVWSPVRTNALASGSSYFGDPQWKNYPARFYRIRSP